MPTPPPDVWVRDLTVHTPAHRVTNPQLYADERHHPIYQIGCPPGVMAGGQLITRSVAKTLQVHVCCRCFPVTGPRPRPMRKAR